MSQFKALITKLVALHSEYRKQTQDKDDWFRDDIVKSFNREIETVVLNVWRILRVKLKHFLVFFFVVSTCKQKQHELMVYAKVFPGAQTFIVLSSGFFVNEIFNLIWTVSLVFRTDGDNTLGSTIKRWHYHPKNGRKRQRTEKYDQQKYRKKWLAHARTLTHAYA